MRSKLLLMGLSAVALTWGAGWAQAGAIRTTATLIGKGSAAVARSTPAAAGNAADGIATAGKATGGAVIGAAGSAGKGIAAAPIFVAHGTASAAKAAWKAIW